MLDFAFSGNSISSFPTNEISCNISKEHNVHEHYLSYDQQQNNYKYILDVQGFSWSSRLKYLLMLDMLILKVEDNYVDFTSQFVIGGIHYLSISEDISDLEKQIHWAKENE